MPDDQPQNPVDPAPDDDPMADEAELVAYLDGELDGDQARAVESKMALDPQTRAKAEALKKTYDLLDYLPRTEPSPNFTQRTLTRIDPPPGVTHTPAPSSPSFTSGFGSPSQPPTGRFRVVGWIAAGLLACVAGYLGHAIVPPTPPKDAGELAYSDVRVVERLPLFLGVDDLDFLRRLDEDGLFPDDPDDGGTAKPGSPEPVTDAQREKLEALFRSFPPSRQQQLRDLDRQLHEQDPPTRERLTAVLERYAVWLDRLVDADRKEVLSAPSPSERFEAVGRVKRRTWRAALPDSHRQRLEGVSTTEERDKLVADYRKQEADRRAAWELARRQWDTFRNQGKPWPFTDRALAAEVEEFAVKVLKPRLNATELNYYNRVRDDVAQDTTSGGKGLAWSLYGLMLLEFNERHRTLPEYGPDAGKPVLTVNDLPKPFVRELQAKAGVNRKTLQNLPTGRWPDFAEAVAAEAKALGVPLPAKTPFGPSKPGEFTPTVNEFVSGALKGKLRQGEWQALTRLEGQWPEYPRKMIELAVAKDLSVPGVTLPGPPSQWAYYYQRPRGKR